MTIFQDQNYTQSVSATAEKYVFPASFAQQRLWFLDRLIGPSGLYNIAWAIRLDGVLDVPALQHSLDALVDRHEALRTGFIGQGSEAVQVISPPMPLVCTLAELPDMETDRDGAARLILETAANQPFDLTKAPLIRTLLLKLSAQTHILLVTVHHSVFDGWSLAIFKHELAALYSAFSLGVAADLPDLPIQYADYAVWQREWLRGGVLTRQLDYWRGQLSGAATLVLPTDRPRPPQLSYRGTQAAIRLPAALSQDLKALAQQHNATLFMVLLAALQVLLHRYSGQDDIVVGTAIAGRTRQETEHLLGFFANTLALRADLSGNPSFCQLLGQVRKVCLEAYNHQELPFEKLVADMQLPRDRSRNPLFQVMLVLEPPSGEQGGAWAGLSVAPVAVAQDSAKFDLTLLWTEQPDGLSGVIEYSTDLFDAATVERMVGHLQTLLAGIVGQPDCTIGELPLLTAAERQQLLVGWNATQTDYPKDRCIHHLFETQAASTPQAIAVVFGREQLSYQVLNAKANQLAHYLISLHVAPEQAVGICLARSPAMIIAVLAILKAGACYVPLDPLYPKARLELMLTDAQVPVLITQGEYVADLADTQALIVDIAQLEALLSSFSTHNPAVLSQPEHSAYILYTSGSTGRPKGVAMPHRALVNLLNWQTDGLQQRPERRVLQFTSLNFDVSFQEIFSALSTGGGLVLITEAQRKDPRLLLAAIVSHKVTDLYLPFIALQQLAHTHASVLIDSHLVVIITAGEKLHATPAIKQFIKNLGGCRLVNQYGPTECHVVTAFDLPEDIRTWAEFPSIGRPIANTEIYLLDCNRQPVPVGVFGIIHIGGDCLAKGYYQQPELTAGKFIAHPFSNKPHARLYDTGDLARYLPDGNVEFLGRIDNQVKLRGYRIELGEIEAVLRRYPGIHEAVVLAREDQPGDKRLVAYLLHPQQGQPDSSALALFVKAELPDYMLPSAFVVLAEWPLTPNGKLDRQALPAPDLLSLRLGHNYAPPSSATEEAMVVIWQEVLGISPIGVHDDFFELGGDSLFAMQLLVRIEEHFHNELPLSLLFDEPTISSFAKQLDVVLKQNNAGKHTPIQALRRKSYQITEL
ncbi:non-ribosomal peptide synthetase [Methylovulum psychrotolerans]|uniref:Non-ribosomal peptide synthetase n=1 Tax=Methylovulum psychrotolerans TaxID=1704499 RepID=A0A2S5CGA6_9GAMM|nr:non-ribosomal peptide synthetase [Methylovulum psychrotolerans]POZ49834.1 non-ribosomal peptide synthetase [Methylovulum psychrotolerans]